MCVYTCICDTHIYIHLYVTTSHLFRLVVQGYMCVNLHESMFPDRWRSDATNTEMSRSVTKNKELSQDALSELPTPSLG